jgi:hypothetical protein
MTSQQLTISIPGSAPALVTLPQPLTLGALADIEQAIASTLGMWRRDLLGATRDAGAIEYASWLQQLQQLQPVRL